MTTPINVEAGQGGAPIEVSVLTVGYRGPQGDVGPANTLTVGTVTTGAAGSAASATITGTAPNQTLSLTIPRGNVGETGEQGEQGDPGPANSLSVGTVTTGAAGSSAAVTITGTSPSQTINLTIPRGDTGATGPTGSQGPQGDPGPANTLSIGTVTTGAAGSSASATVTGTSPNQTINLTIPRGDTGSTGSTGDDGRDVELQASATHLQWRYVGDSTWTNLVALSALLGPANTLTIGTVSSGGSAAATITGSAPNQTLNLTLPAGPAGADGQDGSDVVFQASATHLQWKYASDSTWNNLVALSTITGPAGPNPTGIILALG